MPRHRRSRSTAPRALSLRPLLVAAALAPIAPLATPLTAQQAPTAAATPAVDPALFQGLRWRMVGPARGGRVTTATGVATQPHTFYFGSTGGGVWRTTDAGQSWVNISDGQIKEGSIGAVEVAPSDPNVLWVGTGSDGMRSNVSTGRGLYRTTDGGKTWAHVGLRESGHVGGIRIHPRDPNTAFVAAIGNGFRPNAERGVFRTRDAGKSWEKVLFVSDSTGAVDVEFKPDDPNTLYASMWRTERKPWTIISGAYEGGIYKSTDGGTTWRKLEGGLPKGLFGKSNLAVSAANPQRVYALIEAGSGSGLWRSDDAGTSWAQVSSQPTIITRPFYYTNITADPTNADVVYTGAEGFFKSTDGGKTFRSRSTPHGDNHDLWINPSNAELMIQANDGGVNVSLNGGRTWSTQYNQPTAEIYQVAVDDQYPYRLYGAQQDNSTLIVPSLPTTSSSPDDPIQSWQQGPGCETGPIVPHPTNPDTVYGSCKGQFSRTSLRSGQEWQSWVGAQSLYGNPGKDLIYRFQRVSPMEVSPHDPRVLYYGSQHVHRTRDEGTTWERISPDLTANDPQYQSLVSGAPITIDVTGEEYYSTLYAIRESTLEPGVIWTGANDGPIHVTRDGGKTWAKVTPPDLGPGGRVQNIEPSPHRRGGAYVAVLRYLLGDFKPYLYATNDYGKTWRLLTPGDNGIPADEPTRVVREDPARAGLLYAGTEFGMYVSFDDGRRWQSLQLNLPNTPITDLRVHRHDLVISTQGRAFWILDNVTPLQALADQAQRTRLARAPAHLFRPREAMRTRYRASFGGLEAERAATADPQYPPAGAMLDYWFARAPEGQVTLDILDSTGAVVRSITSVAPGERTQAVEGNMRAPAFERTGIPRLDVRPGMRRFVWDYALPGPIDAATQRPGRNGPMALPGRYTARLTIAAANGGASPWTMSQPLVVRPDPRVVKDGITPAVLRTQLAHNLRMRDMVSETNRLVARVRAARTRLNGAPPGTVLQDSLRLLQALEGKLVTPSIRYSRPGLQAHINYLYGMTLQADQRVPRDATERYQVLRRELDALQAEARKLLGPEPAATAATTAADS
ncbi:MAG: WD40/YVTN/BNR-like repeat-containing protein [Gemmatirosa sp.]